MNKAEGKRNVKSSKLNVEKEAGYWVLKINNPPVNALSEEVLQELNDLFTLFSETLDARVAIITGTGPKIFSAGADIKQLERMQAGGELTIDGQELFSRIELSRKPVIAALQGSAFGGGMELALSCHLRILSSAAQIGLPEVKLGIMPGWGATQRLPRLIGRTRALEIMLTGEPLTAELALAYGLVNKIMPAAEVLPEAKQLASRLAKGAPLAMGKILEVVQKGAETGLEEGLRMEYSAFRTLIVTNDAKEGAEAFLEKRPGQFTGR
jgi:enoyl-CoA hydratase/carnithine racemase